MDAVRSKEDDKGTFMSRRIEMKGRKEPPLSLRELLIVLSRTWSVPHSNIILAVDYGFRTASSEIA